MRNAKRIAAGIFAAVFLFILMSSTLFVVENCEHNCTGDNCSVCAMMGSAINTLSSVKNSGAPQNASLMVLTLFVLFAVAFSGFSNNFKSLIDLRVKMTI